ncbi:MAG: outer membrane lipoprotein carrier protein LolA, partial [Pirellulales bacterium]
MFVVAALGVVLLSSDNTSTVWADMVETILNAKSAKFTMTVTVEGQQPQTFVAMVLEPNRFRQEMPGGTVNIADWNVGKMVGLNPSEKKATVITISDRPESAGSQDFFQRIKEQLLDEQTNPEVKREALGKKTVDGCAALGFRITSPGQTMTIWGDPVSGLPYRIESTMKMVPNTRVVMSDFEINVDLDESLFSLEPPVDYAIVTIDVP